MEGSMTRIVCFSGIPVDVLEWVDERAKVNHRTRSAQLVLILREAYKKSQNSENSFEFTPLAEQLINQQ